MNSLTVFYLLGAVVALTGASVNLPALKIGETELVQNVPGVIQNLFNDALGKLILRQEQFDDPLLISAGSEPLEIDDINMSGDISWSDGTVIGLSKLNYTDFEYSCGFAPGSTLSSWSGELPSVTVEIPNFAFDFGYNTTEFSVNLIKLRSSNLKVGLNAVAANMKADGNCNEEEVKVSALTLGLGVTFVVETGTVTLNGDVVSLVSLRDSLTSLFASIWNNRTQPMFQDYLMCAVNIAFEKCTSETIANCAQEPGINNPECKSKLEDLIVLPTVPVVQPSGAESVMISWFNFALVTSIVLSNMLSLG